MDNLFFVIHWNNDGETAVEYGPFLELDAAIAWAKECDSEHAGVISRQGIVVK